MWQAINFTTINRLSCITIEDISLSLVVVVPLGYYRGVEQWPARYFDLVEVRGSNPCPATMNINFKNDTIMNILTLSIKQKYFDEILAGTKTHEYREIRPTNAKKYITYLCGGKEYKADEELPEEGEVELKPIKYDAIKLLTGAYNSGKRPYIIVEVKNAEAAILTDESGNDIVYEHQGEEYLAAQIDYTLGKVLEKYID